VSQEPTPNVVTEETREYREGRRARRANRPDDDNPYPTGRGFSNRRFSWFVGWLDEWYDEEHQAYGFVETSEPKPWKWWAAVGAVVVTILAVVLFLATR
jgi:hypothetical protein